MVLVLFVEKLVTGLPSAIKEKGRTQNKDEQSDVQDHLIEGNEVIVVVVFEENRMAN